MDGLMLEFEEKTIEDRYQVKTLKFNLFTYQVICLITL